MLIFFLEVPANLEIPEITASEKSSVHLVLRTHLNSFNHVSYVVVPPATYTIHPDPALNHMSEDSFLIFYVTHSFKKKWKQLLNQDLLHDAIIPRSISKHCQFLSTVIIIKLHF